MATGEARILIVDDNRETSKMLESVLELSGYEVESAASGAMMLSRAKDWAPDLILLDIMLPDIDGFSALEELRSRETSERTPVIMLTGLTEPSHRVRGIRSGADDYLGKPFDVDELLSRVSLRLHQSREIRQERRAAVRSRVLAIGTVAPTEQVSDVVVRITSLTRELLNAAASLMVLWNEEQRALVGAGSAGLSPSDAALFSLRSIPDGAHPALDEIIQTHQPFECAGGAPEPLAGWLTELHLVTSLGIPVFRAHQFHGVLLAGRYGNMPHFGDDDIALLRSIADQAGLALTNVSAIGHLAQQARTDALTGLYNSRYFQEVLEHHLVQAQRSGEPTAILMLDVDNFKRVNDDYGHLTGDSVLKAVGLAITASVRASDTVARYGGDEFVVILPGATRVECERVAERILCRVRESTAVFSRPSLSVTISGGIASTVGSEQADSLIQAADSALYEAKAAGRNCVR